MCVCERCVSGRKRSISCWADGGTGGDPIPPGSLLKLWYKSPSEKTEGPSSTTQLLYCLLLQTSSVWAPRPKGSLNEEAELEVMPEIGEGFGMKGGAAYMKCVFSKRRKQVLLCYPVVKPAVSESVLQYGYSATESLSLRRVLQVHPSSWTLHRTWEGSEIEFYPSSFKFTSRGCGKVFQNGISCWESISIAKWIFCRKQFEETNHRKGYIVTISFLQTLEACDSAWKAATNWKLPVWF